MSESIRDRSRPSPARLSDYPDSVSREGIVFEEQEQDKPDQDGILFVEQAGDEGGRQQSPQDDSSSGPQPDLTP